MQHYDNRLVGGVNVPTNVETAVATITLTPQQGSLATNPTAANPVPTMIQGLINLTVGTATTNIFVRIRQGVGVTGNAVQADTITGTPGATQQIPFQTFDNVGANAYTLTVQQLSATGNGTLNDIQFNVDNGLSGLV